MTIKPPPVDDMLAEAKQVEFSKIALLVLLFPFWGFGWAAGHAWTALAFFGVSIRRGWRDATGWDLKQELIAMKRQAEIKVQRELRGRDDSKVLPVFTSM